MKKRIKLKHEHQWQKIFHDAFHHHDAKLKGCKRWRLWDKARKEKRERIWKSWKAHN